MKTSASIPNSEMLQLLEIGIYCAYVYDLKGKTHIFSTNADTQEEAFEGIENMAEKLGIQISKIELFDPNL